MDEVEEVDPGKMLKKICLDTRIRDCRRHAHNTDDAVGRPGSTEL